MSTPLPLPAPPRPIPPRDEGTLNLPESAPLPVGTRIGGDVVEAVLGSGGFATVYRVRSPEGHLSALNALASTISTPNAPVTNAGGWGWVHARGGLQK